MRSLLSCLVAALALSPIAAHAEDHPDCPGKSGKEADGASCHHGPVNADKPQPGFDKTGMLVRGEKLKGAPRVVLADLVRSPEPHNGKTVQLEGKVRKACTKMGCWMELAAGEKGTGVRVTFKDYGFFVPLDSAGATAKVEGQVVVAELSDNRAKHYESEGGTVPRGKDGKPREVQLVATGIELRR